MFSGNVVGLGRTSLAKYPVAKFVLWISYVAILLSASLIRHRIEHSDGYLNEIIDQ